LYYTIKQHCLTAPMLQANHSMLTDWTRCILPNISKSWQIHCQITNNLIKIILTKLHNIFSLNHLL